MRFVLCQPANIRFQWEVEVCVTNLLKLGYNEITVLFARDDSSVEKYMTEKYKDVAGVEVHFIDVNHNVTNAYHPAIKPYLWWKALDQGLLHWSGQYLYMDSDVILRERLDESKLQGWTGEWLGSDCSHYLDYDYVMRCKHGEYILNRMAEICNVSPFWIKHLKGFPGAQWLVVNPDERYWHKVYENSLKIYEFLKVVDSDIQKWTAEMWAQVYTMADFGITPTVSDELDFAWATDPIERYYETKLLHNAGVTFDQKNLFFKGSYTHKSPFNDQLPYDETRCSSKYVDAIRNVKMEEN